MSDSSPDLGAMVSKLLGDPELLSQIASTVGINTPPPAEGEKNESAEDAKSESAEDKGEEAKPVGGMGGIDQLLPMLSMFGGGGGGKPSGGGDSARRCALLSALKPFCNSHRCRTIDYMIGISKLSETLIPTKRG